MQYAWQASQAQRKKTKISKVKCGDEKGQRDADRGTTHRDSQMTYTCVECKSIMHHPIRRPKTCPPEK